MTRGKQTCRILKEIRRQIAEANDIELVTEECRYKGDCPGTCPKCEAEVRYLEQRLRARSLAGKAVALAGVSAASLAMLASSATQAQPQHDFSPLPADSVTEIRIDTQIVKGSVKGKYITDSIATDDLVEATVTNLATGKSVLTDIDGKFEIEAAIGDSLVAAYVGYSPDTIRVESTSSPVTIVLNGLDDVIEDVFVGAFGPQYEKKHYIDLKVYDKDGDLIDNSDLDVERVWTDKDGNEHSEEILTAYWDEKHPCRIFWNYGITYKKAGGNPVKEATLHIKADGYEPVSIQVKYPRHHSTKKIRLTPKKK